MKTEEEIIKGLEYCSTNNFCSDKCPYYGISCDCNCETTTMKDTLHLLKKQQAEINRLKKYDEERDIRLHARLIATAKSEAVKEFAERLKEKSYKTIRNYGLTKDVVEVCDIDNLVEEMAGYK